MTGSPRSSWRNRRPDAARRPTRIATRADWRKLIALAQACAADADRGALDDGEARVRMMTLARNTGAADPTVFGQAGAATVDTVAGFLRMAKAFARAETPDAMRQDLATLIADGAAFVDRAMDRMATDDFRAAHRNQPEIWS